MKAARLVLALGLAVAVTCAACRTSSSKETQQRPPEAPAAKPNLPQAYVDFYEQRVEIAFRSAEAAQRAELAALPLFDGKEWAISSRWDDNNPDDVKMRDVLAKHGYKGTFYLNSQETYSGPDSAALEKALLKGDNTIGGHSWTHPFLTYCSRNAMFDQVGRVRVAREASSDSTICSYAFSFCDFANPVEGDVIRTDIAEVLFRAGYFHAANAVFIRDTESTMLVSHLLPADGMAPIDEPFAEFLADPEAKRTNPNISFDMHVWYKTPEQWASFEAELDRYGHKPDW